MRIFEISFSSNSPKKNNVFLDSFSFEPEKKKEKARGSLYIIGEFQHPLEFQQGFLRALAKTIKEAYYSSPLVKAQDALRSAAAIANAKLRGESGSGNTSWIGNLHVCCVVLVTVQENKTEMHVIKTGEAQAFVFRHKLLIDIGKNLDVGEDPAAIFKGIASTTLVPEDIVSVMTKGVYDVLSKGRIEDVGLIKIQKTFEEFFEKRKRALLSATGILLHAVIEREQRIQQKQKKGLHLFNRAKSILQNIKSLSLKKVAHKIKEWFFARSPLVKKHIIVISLLLLLLLVGFLMF